MRMMSGFQVCVEAAEGRQWALQRPPAASASQSMAEGHTVPHTGLLVSRNVASAPISASVVQIIKSCAKHTPGCCHVSEA